uniref:Uncharacterized protein n=1 Tax=Setaria digitata TaxID=48799 RepID=A0A915Q3N7_9BILA
MVRFIEITLRWPDPMVSAHREIFRQLFSSDIAVIVVLMYRAMRSELQPFCTTTGCNRSCHQVHRLIQDSSPSSASVSTETKRSLLRNQNHSFVQELETRSEPVAVASLNSGCVFRTPLPSPKRAITLEEIIELAKRKASHNCEEPLSQKHYVTDDDDEQLPVEEPAIQASELVKDNEWTSDDWAYLEQLIESDTDRISPSDEPPTTTDNDDDTAVFPLHRVCFSASFMRLK